MVALSIAEQDDFENIPVFVIVDAFNGAREVYEKLFFEFKDLQSPIYFSLRKSALTFLKQQNFDNLFIDSDIGLKNYLTLALLEIYNPKILINIYEEGLGTYRSDLYSGIKKILLESIGAGVFFGASRFVKNVYVFSADEYCVNFPKNAFKVKKIEINLFDFVVSNHLSLKRLFEFEGINSNSLSGSICSLYLSDWTIDKNFLMHFQGLHGDLFVKLHPHVRINLKMDDIQVVDARVPAELLLIDLMEKYKLVRVFDHNSSIRRYFNCEKIFYNSVN